MTSNWFFQEEVKWRTLASGIWTFVFSFIIFSCFLFIWIFSPFHHVINICDYFFLILSFFSWFVSSCVAILCAIFVKIFVNHYSVVYKLEYARIHMLSKYFHLKNILLSLCSGFLFGLISMFVINFSTKKYAVFTECQSSIGNFRCLNEAFLIFVLFGVFLGCFNDIVSQANHQYTIQFPMEQLGRFLSVKLNLSTSLVSCGKQSLAYVKYFLVAYYFLGVFPRYSFSVVMDHPFCDKDLIGFGNFTAMLSAVWALWIFGTMMLLVFSMSWHLFNSYYTKMFAFPVHSVFPEDDKKLLTNNLNKKQPLMVQHLAFRYLSFISVYSKTKRKEIFVMKSKWDCVSLECLERINELSEKLKVHHGHVTASKSQSMAFVDSTSSMPDSASPLPASTLRRRPLFDVTNSSQLNTSVDEVSRPNVTLNPNAINQLDRSALLNNSRITVPTPKLWTRPQSTAGVLSRSEMHSRSGDEPPASFGSRSRDDLLSRANRKLKQIPFVAYFVKDIPDRVVADIFSHHNIYKWAIESISLLAAASLSEDDHGFVQQRLPLILDSLFDLLAILEKSSKLPVTPTSAVSSFLLRQQQALKSETKTAIYRIVNTFLRYVDDIPVKQEHHRRLKSFVEQKE